MPPALPQSHTLSKPLEFSPRHPALHNAGVCGQVRRLAEQISAFPLVIAGIGATVIASSNAP